MEQRRRSRSVLAHVLLALIGAVAIGAPLQAALQRFEAVEPHMGTLVRITVYTTDERAAADAFRAAFARIAELDRTLSDYQPDSELNTITRTAVGHAVPISKDLYDVLRKSRELAEATGGAFDITQGPVIRLWREARKSARLPDPDALNEAAKRTGYRKLHVDDRLPLVRLAEAGMALDVGAIGKGYAASKTLEVLGKLGIESALVAVSGDLAFSDAPPGQRGWRIAMYDGEHEITGVPRVLELTNAAVSTSGSSEQHVDVNGRRYSHIIDPSSRMGLTYDRTVTVIARSGLDADGLDTAVSVLDAERGLQLIESCRDAAALVIDRTPAAVSVQMSSRFRDLVSPPNPERTSTFRNRRGRP